MANLGLSKANILKGIFVAIILLLIAFVFILCGISGFTTGSTLGSVVNSLMPIGAGGLLGRAGQLDVTEKIKQIANKIKEVLLVLTITDV